MRQGTPALSLTVTSVEERVVVVDEEIASVAPTADL
jgi:hypothetical protein